MNFWNVSRKNKKIFYLGIFRNEKTKNNFSREQIRRVKTTKFIKGKEQRIECCRNIFNSENILLYKKNMSIDDELQTLPDNFALHEVGESSRKRLNVLKRKFSDCDYLVECRIVMEAIGKKCAF